MTITAMYEMWVFILHKHKNGGYVKPPFIIKVLRLFSHYNQPMP